MDGKEEGEKSALKHRHRGTSDPLRLNLSLKVIAVGPENHRRFSSVAFCSTTSLHTSRSSWLFCVCWQRHRDTSDKARGSFRDLRFPLSHVLCSGRSKSLPSKAPSRPCRSSSKEERTDRKDRHCSCRPLIDGPSQLEPPVRPPSSPLPCPPTLTSTSSQSSSPVGKGKRPGPFEGGSPRGAFRVSPTNRPGLTLRALAHQVSTNSPRQFRYLLRSRRDVGA